MRIHRNLLIAAASAVVATGTIVSTSVLTASAAPRAATEHFQIVSVGNSPNDVILWGSVTGHAIDVENHANTVSVLKFSNGTMTIKHPVKSASQNFNPKTCFGTIVEHGTYKITGGTRAYKGASGSGKYQATILIIAAKSHGHCSQTKQPVAVHVVIDATGSMRS